MTSFNREKSSRNVKNDAWYEAAVRDLAYRTQLALEVEQGAVFIVANGERELLCRPLIAKKFWFETWAAFTARYASN